MFVNEPTALAPLDVVKVKIHLFDDDQRRHTDPTYHINHGSFASITRNINKELEKLGLAGTEESADIYGFASGIKWDFGFHDKRRFHIGVWETNVLPNYLIQCRQVLEGKNFHVFGLSKQIADVWESYGFPTKVVDIGADTYFWAPQSIPKFDKFTILSTTSCNFRSGINCLIEAFLYACEGDKDIRLIIKNTDDRCHKLKHIVNRLQGLGYDIIYLQNRDTLLDIRKLMAQSHLLCYNVLNTSAGLPIVEAASMELPCIVGDICPTNIYPSVEKIKTTPTSIANIKHVLTQEWGLPYTFPDGWIDESKALMYSMDIHDFAQKILNIKRNYDIYIERGKECRKQILDRWTWKHSCQQLLRNLNICN